MAILNPRSVRAGRARAGACAPHAACLLWLAAALAWLAAAAAPLGGAPPPQNPLEYEVKAAFLFNFAKFIEWPPEAFGDRDSLALCVFGEDPFGGILESTVTGEKIAGRQLRLRQVERPSELRSCQIAFISGSERERVPEVLAALRAANVLTVGENDRFAAQGGMVRFFLEANRVRFEINLDAVEHTRLVVSSKLLRVARVVRPEGRGH